MVTRGGMVVMEVFIFQTQDIKTAFKIIKTSFVYNEENKIVYKFNRKNIAVMLMSFGIIIKFGKSKGKVKKSVLEMCKIINNSL